MTKDYPWGKGTVNVVTNVATNDSDKTLLTVATGKVALVKLIDSQLTNTATVGNRAHTILITDGTNTVAATGTTGTASQVTRVRMLPGSGFSTTAIRSLSAPTTNVNAAVTDSLPADGLLLKAGSVVRVYDSAAVDAAADDLVTVIVYVEYDA